MALPVLTTAEDVREIVRYLKTKATGATMAELKATLKPQTLDGRKMNAYQVWGIVQKDGDRFKLAPVGWEIARKPDEEFAAFRRIIDGLRPYRSVLEWAHHQEIQELTNVDVAAHWHEHHGEALGTTNENSIKDSAVCFFHLAQGARLGKLVMGRRGQATRLGIDRIALADYLEGGPSTPPWQAQARGDEDLIAAGSGVAFRQRDEEPVDGEAENMEVGGASNTPNPAIRVFISHGKNGDIVEQVQTMLALAGFESEVAENEETSAIPVPEKVFSSMRRCGAGIIAVTVEDGRRDTEGRYVVNDNVLIEIGAAFVLYDRKVVLLWDRRIEVPSNLQGLYRCEFEGGELTWSAGMKLMKALQTFRVAGNASVTAPL